MVVLALAIGVAEQDDFANIPDLQETTQAAPAANQEPSLEKRYRITCASAWCVCVCERENVLQTIGVEGNYIKDK